MLLICGCARDSGSPQVKAAGADDPAVEVVTGFRGHRIVERLPEWKSPMETVRFPNMPKPEALGEIARRRADSLEKWQDYRSALDQALKLQKPERPAPEPNGNDRERGSRDSLIQQVANSPETLNWRMRITLLEYRLDTANEEDRPGILEKLEVARESLKAAEKSALE